MKHFILLCFLFYTSQFASAQNALWQKIETPIPTSNVNIVGSNLHIEHDNIETRKKILYIKNLNDSEWLQKELPFGENIYYLSQDWLYLSGRKQITYVNPETFLATAHNTPNEIQSAPYGIGIVHIKDKPTLIAGDNPLHIWDTQTKTFTSKDIATPDDNLPPSGGCGNLSMKRCDKAYFLRVSTPICNAWSPCNTTTVYYLNRLGTGYTTTKDYVDYIINENNLIYLTTQGVLRSTDKRVSFQNVLPIIYAYYYQLSGIKETLYLSKYSTGGGDQPSPSYISFDEGATWKPLTHPAFQNSYYQNPYPPKIFHSQNNRLSFYKLKQDTLQIFQSNNLGDDFTEFSVQLPVIFKDSFQIIQTSQSGDFVVMGVVTNADNERIVHIYKTPSSTLVSNDAHEEIPSDALNIFPNPSKEYTTINLVVNQAKETKIQVLNILGQVVQTVHKGIISAGNHNFKLDTSTFSSGVYYIHIETKDGIQTKPLTVIN